LRNDDNNMQFMHTLKFLCAIALLISVSNSVPAQPDNGAGTLVVHGRIWTANRDQPWADAIAVRGERVVAVGSRQEIDRFINDKTEVIDAGNGLVVPGLIDSHIHLVDGGLQLTRVQLRDAVSREEFARRIGEFAKKLKLGEWITGGEWDHTIWGGELPSRDWIDAVTPNTPVWINRLDGHMALANSAAMRAARVGDEVADVAGGEIVRDAAGRPTGIFKDNAMSLIDRAVPEVSLDRQVDATLAAMDYLAERGVTAVHHMGTWQHVDVFRAARQRGKVNTRIYACVPLNTWDHLAKEVQQKGRGDHWLKIGGLKGYVDGSLGSHTAALLDAFTDAPNDRGLLVNTVEDLEHWTREADRAGLQVAVHAIGDRANRLQLDVFERVAKANGPRDRRFRIEHAQHIAPDDIPRFAKLGVIASMQPYHTIDDGRWAEAVIGRKRSETSYAFRSLLDAGARLAFGSDWSVAPPTPIEGIYAAVTRRTLDGKHPGGWIPEQKISVEEALRAYTLDAAYASFCESDLGSLEPGKLADMVIVDRDLFDPQVWEASPTPIEASNDDSHDHRQQSRLPQIQATIVGGEIAYQKTESPQAATTNQ
jgi:predicted amidohydrolase YtcJ